MSYNYMDEDYRGIVTERRRVLRMDYLIFIVLTRHSIDSLFSLLDNNIIIPNYTVIHRLG